MRTHLIHRPARDIIPPLWSSSFLLSGLILPAHAAAASLVHRNSEPSTQMRCMITANRRASATVASLIGRLGSSAFRLSTPTVWMSLTGSCFSSESAPRPFHHGIRRRGGTILGTVLPLRTAGPSRHANSPHPSSREGHHSTAVELEFPPIGFDPAGSCCCGFSGPPELGAVNPDAVHDHGQSARQRHGRFSNRPFGVKRFQTIHPYSVDVAHGLVLLFGIGTKALPSWDSKTRWNNLRDGLTVANGRSKQTCELTSSIVPRGTSFHRCGARVSSYRV